MNENILKQIFLENKLDEVFSISKIEIGFTNKVYSVNDQYIIKICDDVDNEYRFEREVFLYKYFSGKIPVPNVIVYDDSKSVHDKQYIIYHKIQGDNLYSKWHLMNNEQRRSVFKQLCNYLKVINNAPYDDFVELLKLKDSVDWHDKIYSKLQKSLKYVKDKKILSKEFIQIVDDFIELNHGVLLEQEICLVYSDAHFDNVLIKDNEIVGLLDFERTEMDSIDFGLDIFGRMIRQPAKYISEKFEKFVKAEDYSQLLVWFEEFYPEPFQFKDLSLRLDLYSIKHDLEMLQYWPDVANLRKSLSNTVDYKGPIF